MIQWADVGLSCRKPGFHFPGHPESENPVRVLRQDTSSCCLSESPWGIIQGGVGPSTVSHKLVSPSSFLWSQTFLHFLLNVFIKRNNQVGSQIASSFFGLNSKELHKKFFWLTGYNPVLGFRAASLSALFQKLRDFFLRFCSLTHSPGLVALKLPERVITEPKTDFK